MATKHDWSFKLVVMMKWFLVPETHPAFWMMPERNKYLTIDPQIQKEAHISLPLWPIDDKNSYAMKMSERHYATAFWMCKKIIRLLLMYGCYCLTISIASGHCRRTMPTSVNGGRWSNASSQNNAARTYDVKSGWTNRNDSAKNPPSGNDAFGNTKSVMNGIMKCTWITSITTQWNTDMWKT